MQRNGENFMINTRRKLEEKSLREVSDYDVELCRTSSKRAYDCMRKKFITESVPFTGVWERVPLYKRLMGGQSKEICIVMTHKNQYFHARRVLDCLDRKSLSRIQLHIV